MAWSPLLLALVAAALVGAAAVQGDVVEHTFEVGELKVRRLCRNKIITAVNGQFPGPTLHVHEGDTVLVHVLNRSPHNMSLHWHGIFQRLTPWADGPTYVTQCPIPPGGKYTYRFTVVDQRGTLWWHAHVSLLRATVYGALIIKPREGTPYPFPKPYKEIPILFGEWWNANVVDVAKQALALGAPPNNSDAFTINGRPGDLYRCSNKHTFKLRVVQGETYLLRIINAAVNNQLFFKIAGHSFTVVATDASYTTPYTTDVIVSGPGQTVDALLVADAPQGSYYMAARAYISSSFPAPFPNTTTTGILQYVTADAPLSPPAKPLLPDMPAFNDTPTAHKFYTSLTALLSPERQTVPLIVDESMFITVGLGAVPCASDQPLCNPSTGAIAGAMNNISFQFPNTISLLEAQFKKIPGLYTPDFPNYPARFFNFTDQRLSLNPSLLFTTKATKVKRLKYNARVQVVLQNTAIIGIENHPIHLHGFDFFILAQGFGNFNPYTAPMTYNLVHPLIRNTITVPTGGWAVIRFVANNPGMWLLHCHLDAHLPIGLATAFEVLNGPTPSSTLPPPPPDFPKC